MPGRLRLKRAPHRRRLTRSGSGLRIRPGLGRGPGLQSPSNRVTSAKSNPSGRPDEFRRDSKSRTAMCNFCTLSGSIPAVWRHQCNLGALGPFRALVLCCAGSASVPMELRVRERGESGGDHDPQEDHQRSCAAQCVGEREQEEPNRDAGVPPAPQSRPPPPVALAHVAYHSIWLSGNPPRPAPASVPADGHLLDLRNHPRSRGTCGSRMDAVYGPGARVRAPAAPAQAAFTTCATSSRSGSVVAAIMLRDHLLDRVGDGPGLPPEPEVLAPPSERATTSWRYCAAAPFRVRLRTRKHKPIRKQTAATTRLSILYK